MASNNHRKILSDRNAVSGARRAHPHSMQSSDSSSATQTSSNAAAFSSPYQQSQASSFRIRSHSKHRDTSGSSNKRTTPKSSNNSFFSRVSSFIQNIGAPKEKTSTQCAKKCTSVAQGTLREVAFCTTEWETDSTDEEMDQANANQ